MNTTLQMTVEKYKELFEKKGKNKYNAEICEYAGRKYDSKGEMNYAIRLQWRVHAGEIKHIEPQYKIKIEVSGVFICHYVIDFKIELKNGTFEYHEYKGMETEVWKLKWKLVKALYPDWTFVLIKNQ